MGHDTDADTNQHSGGEDQAFIRAICAAPNDAALNLVYADWLEERGDERAECLRVQATLAQGGVVDAFTWSRFQTLVERLDPAWLAAMRGAELPSLRLIRRRLSGSRPRRPTRSETIDAEVMEFLGRGGGKNAFTPAARQRRNRRKMEQQLRAMSSSDVAGLMSGDFPQPRRRR